MNIFRKLFSRKRVRAETAIGLSDPQLLNWLGINPGEVSYRGAKGLKEATVYACIRILADSIGKLPVKVYQENAGVVVHDMAPLLKIRPNPYMSARDFYKALEVQRNLYGNAYAWIDVSSTGRVGGLYPLDSTRIKIYVDDNGLLDSRKLWYVYTDTNNKEYKLRPDELIHLKGLTCDGLVGLTPLEELRKLVESAGAGTEFLNNSLKHGMQVRGIVHYVGDISREAQAKFKEHFEEMSAGLKNAGRISLLPVGYQYQPLSLNMADAQFVENSQLTIKQIAAAFGIKSHQLNDLGRATYANIGEQQREFYIDTLMDILTGYEQEFTYKLFTRKELSNGWYIKFNVNALLRADPKTRYEGYRVAIQSGFLTPNEARELEEYNGLPGGDRLLINGNMMPIEMAGEQYRKNVGGGE